jgi:hypothetical protein
MELVFCLFVCYEKLSGEDRLEDVAITLNGSLKEQCVKVGIRFVGATNFRLLKVTLCTFILQ